MAYQLSSRAKTLLNQTNIEPNIVLCIGDYGCFGASITKVKVKIGMPGLKIGGGWKIGGTIQDENIVDYISLDGTTTDITQQLDLDKGGATSTQTVDVRLVDINGEITRLISPGFDLNDILYTDAQLYLGFKDGAFPQDYVDLFIGKVQSIKSGSGYIDLTIAHPDELKRAEIFPKFETSLVADAPYYSKSIQDLTYYQSGNYNGIVQVRYLNIPFIGDVANITVSGGLITASIESGVTKANTIKNAIRDHFEANNLVQVMVSGTGTNAQTTQATTSLEVSDELFLESVDGLYLPHGDIFKTYVRIDDEIIEYTGIDTTLKKLTGCVRRSLNSLGKSHKIDDAVQSFYKLGDNTDASNAIDLALMLMLSDGIGSPYLTGIEDLQFYNFGTLTNYPNGLLITGVDAVRRYNIRAGDLFTVSGASNPANNFTDQVIEAVDVIDLGTIVYIAGQSFVSEPMSAALGSVKSQYNVLPDGCGFIPNQVDIDRFKQIQSRFPSSIANYELYLKDTVKPKDLINTDLFLPSALYSIPRQGKASIGISAPPLYEGGTKTLDITTVKNPSKLKMTRTVSKYFYNSIIYKYNEDSVDDRALSGLIIYSADSVNRIASPNRPYTIEAKGVRPSPTNTQLITRNCKRYLQRFQFAAEQIPVEPDYKTGYTIEVGDSVVFGDSELQVSDSVSGTRDFKPRVFEVVNKSFNWKTGKITLNIVDTNYSASVRYGVWSPASMVKAGSTTTNIKVLNSYGSTSERDKWTQYFGRTVRVRSKDYSISQNVKLVGFDPTYDDTMIVDTLGFTPLDGYIVDTPIYNDLNLAGDSFYKAVHPFWTPTLTVVSGTSSTEFEVSVGDAAKLFEGSTIRIHNADYTVDSAEKTIKVSSVVGTTVTCDDIGFTPSAGQLINLVGFVSDDGNPYVWV
ncbi:MAG TPA: hypothetical protein PK522_00765 [Nitrosomonas sp.]|nr:hypothetical protein [Nitrosomonas sp.]